MKHEFKIEKNKIIFKVDFSKDIKYNLRNTEKYISLVVFKKPEWVSGVTSLCEDNKHILMIDYDNVCRWIVEKELEDLAKKIKCIFYLFSTKEEMKEGELVGNYHAICLRKFYPHEIVKIQNQTSCDYAFTTMPLRNIYRSWVLRISPKRERDKPKFLKVIGKYVEGEISSAHLKLLQSLYNLPKINYKKQDNLNKIYLNKYET